MLGRIRELLRPRPAPVTIAPADLDRLVFGQFTPETQDFFAALCGSGHTIPLVQWPHYRLITEHLDDPTGDNAYQRYLSASWSKRKPAAENTPAARARRTAEFMRLYREIAANRDRGAAAFHTPLELCERPDGRWIVVDGNHRAAIARALGLAVPAVHASPPDYLARAARVRGEYYGAGRLDLPYQSIYRDGVMLVRGRRDDVLERLDCVAAEDLAGRRVIDLGCNLGAHCFAASERGATTVVGVDHSWKLMRAAARLNAYLARDVRFVVQDLEVPLTALPPADTVFCFSLVNHLTCKDGIVETIHALARRVVYFEGSPRAKEEDYGFLLRGGLFDDVQLVGWMREAIDRPERSRPFFRCRVAA